MLSWLDRIVIARADEQVRDVAMREPRDPWRLRGGQHAKRPKRWRRTRCLAGDCDRPVRHHSYCHVHWLRLSVNGDVEGYTFGRKGRG